MIHLYQFLEMMRTERKATRSTLSAYDADLRDFYKFFKDQKLNQPIEAGTYQDIQSYLLTQKYLTPSTVARRLSSLRQFYAFLIRNGKIKENPLSFVQAPPYKSKSLPVLSIEDVIRLLEEAKRGDSGEAKRLVLLLQILYISDIAVNDLVSLPFRVGLEALKSAPHCLTIQGKNKNDLRVMLTEEALESLQEYIMGRDCFLIHQQESPWLFPSSGQKGHLTRQRFGQLLKELSLKVGLPPAHVSLYTIRHGFHKIKQLERKIPYK
jgi:integrase/recombinase XerD